MGMKADARKEPKASKKEAREAMMRLLAENIETRINVIFNSDFGGPVLVAMAEREPGEDHNGKSPFREWSSRPSPFMGWRVVYTHYPDGYLEVFYDSDGQYKTTVEAEA
jgi:hypothetical protein